MSFSTHYLRLKVKITAPNGADLNTNVNNGYGIVNNSLHSLLKHITVQSIGVTVTPSSDYYPYHGFINTLF